MQNLRYLKTDFSILKNFQKMNSILCMENLHPCSQLTDECLIFYVIDWRISHFFSKADEFCDNLFLKICLFCGRSAKITGFYLETDRQNLWFFRRQSNDLVFFLQWTEEFWHFPPQLTNFFTFFFHNQSTNFTIFSF